VRAWAAGNVTRLGRHDTSAYVATHQPHGPAGDLRGWSRAWWPCAGCGVLPRGPYSEIYPDVGFDRTGIVRLFRQFSMPGGIPSHVSVTTP
jgi:hypothetical protein